MLEETNHLYEHALKEENRLREKFMEEFKNIGKPELLNDLQQYAVAFAIRETWESLKGK